MTTYATVVSKNVGTLINPYYFLLHILWRRYITIPILSKGKRSTDIFKRKGIFINRAMYISVFGPSVNLLFIEYFKQ